MRKGNMVLKGVKNVLATGRRRLTKMLVYVREHPFKSLLIGAIAGFFSLFLLFLVIYLGAFGKLPTKAYLKSLKNPVTSTIYASNKEPIGYYYLQNRSNADSSQIGSSLKQALVATEDVRFYEHGGIDYQSYARVLIKSIILQQNTGGGSTITQQVAKNLFGREEQFFLSTPINKIREIFIARRLEKIYDKEDIILLYFNTVSFGENVYGIEKASSRFFNKAPEELTLPESATLVGLLKAPSYYNPRRFPERAQQRRNVVLSQMLKYNYITEETFDEAQIPMKVDYQTPKKVSSFSAYFKDYVAAEFAVWAEDNPAPDGHIYDLEADGLNIYTTLNTNIQKYAESALHRQADNLQKLMDTYWASATTEGGKEVLLKKLVDQNNHIQQMRQAGKTETEIDAFVKEKRKRKYWVIGKGYEEQMQSLEDSITKSINRLHAGVIAVSSVSGRIMGYVGGIDYGFSQIDNVTAPRQVGSTFKPITYLAALQAGEEPCNYYDNNLVTYSKYEDWRPRNSNNKYGGSYSMYGALANSVNTVSVTLQLKTGTERVLDQAKKMGIESELPNVPSIVLGTADISLMEMVTAYASISNGGNKIKPYAIDRIEDEQGNILYEAKPIYEGRVASTENIKTLQKMMEGVIKAGTGSRLLGYEIPYNLIGKTGTTQNNGDGWFIACSPELVVGSWVGTFDKRVQFASTSMGSGSNTALPIVASIFKNLSYWKRPLLSNFEYGFDYFPCRPFVELNAQEAYEFAQTDSIYLQELRVRDTLAVLVDTPITIDSVQGIVPGQIAFDSIVKDSLSIELNTSKTDGNQ
ncbi:transglycosylase domain-containing protein [Arenibacter sp. F26102]|uniref:transglycosylase domain-containing protein n=1 Tax=Arenibacter sp. F26102 TaxID=2926416 RepID=UPI001FF4CD47|nr:transglycosylase domain-containing protein [Arenibacter sp. F26102]MCK0145219.1 transglycosylase domain-containing protein [Arenibacter sp. F26102]